MIFLYIWSFFEAHSGLLSVLAILFISICWIFIERGGSFTSSYISLSAGNDFSNAVVTEEMKRIMECPVCQDIPLPPIYTCQTGHFICIDCQVKLTECPLCKSAYTNSRNFPLESMVQAVKFNCNQHHRGCHVTDTIHQVKKHQEKCIFRPVKCHLSEFDNCMKTLLYMSEYVEHLKHFHKLNRANVINEKAKIFSENFVIEDWGEASSRTDGSWSPSLFYFDDKVFISRTFTRGPIFYFRFYIISNETDASKYGVKIRIQNEVNCKAPTYELTTLVSSIRDIPENPKLLRSGASVHRDLMESLGHIVSAQEDDTRNLEWVVLYKIFKQSATRK